MHDLPAEIDADANALATRLAPAADGAAGRGPSASRISRADVAGLSVALTGGVFLAAALVLFQGSRGAAYDFVAYLDAARRLAAGLPLYQAVTQQGPFSPGPHDLYLYPPPLAVLLLPLTTLATPAATAVWQGLHVVALVLACAVLPVSRWIRLSVFGIACLSLPTLLDLNLGNVSLFVLLGVAAGWRWTAALSRGESGAGGPPGAGLLAAVSVAVRPQIAIVLPWWAWRGTPASRRALLSAVGAGIVLVALSAAVAGLSSWGEYVRLLLNLRSAGPGSSDIGIAAIATQAGVPAPVPMLLYAAGAALALLALVIASRRDQETGFVALSPATLLVVPLLWPHYLVLLVLPAALLAARGHWWALALPLLAWLPGALLAPLALVACWLPVLAIRTTPSRAEPAPISLR